MKTIAFLASAFLLGVMVLLTMGSAQHSIIGDDWGKAATASNIQAVDRVSPQAKHVLVLASQATRSAGLSSLPSALYGAPALPAPPR